MLMKIGNKLYANGKLFSGYASNNLKSGKLLTMNYKDGLLRRADIYEMKEIEDIKPPFDGMKYLEMVKTSVKEYFYENTEKLIRVTKGGFKVFSVRRQINLQPEMHHTDTISGNNQIRIYDWNNQITKCVFPRNKIFSILEHDGDVINEQRYKITDDPIMAKVGNIKVDGKQHFLEPDKFVSHNRFTKESVSTYYNRDGLMTKKVIKNPNLDINIENRYEYDDMKNITSIETYSNNEYIGGELFQYDESGILREHIELIKDEPTRITRFSSKGDVTECVEIPNNDK